MVNEKPQQPEQEEGENKVTPEKDSTQRNVEKKTEETKTKIEKQAKNVGNLPKEVKNEATDGENEELEDNKGKIGDIAQQAKESLESLGFIDIEPQEIFDSLEDKDIDELKGLMEGEPEIAKIERDLEGLSRELKDLESFNPRNKDKRRKNEKNKEAKQKEIDELKKKLDQAKEAVNETAKLNFWKEKIKELLLDKGMEQEKIEKMAEKMAEKINAIIEQQIDLITAEQLAEKNSTWKERGKKIFGFAKGMVKNIAIMGGTYAGVGAVMGALGIATGAGVGLLAVSAGVVGVRFLMKKFRKKGEQAEKTLKTIKKEKKQRDKQNKEIEAAEKKAIEIFLKNDEETKTKRKEEISGVISSEIRKETDKDAKKAFDEIDTAPTPEERDNQIMKNMGEVERAFYLKALGQVKMEHPEASLEQHRNMAVLMAETMAFSEKSRINGSKKLEELKKHKPKIIEWINKFNALKAGTTVEELEKGLETKEYKEVWDKIKKIWEKSKYDVACVAVGTAAAAAVRVSDIARVVMGVVGGLAGGYALGEKWIEKGEKKALKEIATMVSEAEEKIKDIDFPAEKLPELRESALIVQSRLELGLLDSDKMLKSRAENFIFNVSQVEMKNQETLDNLLDTVKENNDKLEEQVEEDVKRMSKTIKRKRAIAMVGGAVAGGLVSFAFTDKGKEVLGSGGESVTPDVEPVTPDVEPVTPDVEPAETNIEDLVKANQALTEANIVEVGKGDSVWSVTEERLKTVMGEKEWDELGKEKQTYLIDRIKDDIVADYESKGLDADILKVGDKIDLNKYLGPDNQQFLGEITGEADDLTKDAIANIANNDEILKEIVSKTGEPLDSDTVDQILVDVKEAGGVDEYLESLEPISVEAEPIVADIKIDAYGDEYVEFAGEKFYQPAGAEILSTTVDGHPAIELINTDGQTIEIVDFGENGGLKYSAEWPTGEVDYVDYNVLGHDGLVENGFTEKPWINEFNEVLNAETFDETKAKDLLSDTLQKGGYLKDAQETKVFLQVLGGEDGHIDKNLGGLLAGSGKFDENVLKDATEHFKQATTSEELPDSENWTPRYIYNEEGEAELTNFRKIGWHKYEISHQDGSIESIKGAGFLGKDTAEDKLQDLMTKKVVEDVEPVTPDVEPVTTGGEPVTTEGEPVTTKEESVTTKEESVTTEEESVTTEGEPVTSEGEPVTLDIEPVTPEGEVTEEVVPKTTDAETLDVEPVTPDVEPVSEIPTFDSVIAKGDSTFSSDNKEELLATINKWQNTPEGTKQEITNYLGENGSYPSAEKYIITQTPNNTAQIDFFNKDDEMLGSSYTSGSFRTELPTGGADSLAAEGDSAEEVVPKTTDAETPDVEPVTPDVEPVTPDVEPVTPDVEPAEQLLDNQATQLSNGEITAKDFINNRLKANDGMIHKSGSNNDFSGDMEKIYYSSNLSTDDKIKVLQEINEEIESNNRYKVISGSIKENLEFLERRQSYEKFMSSDVYDERITALNEIFESKDVDEGIVMINRKIFSRDAEGDISYLGDNFSTKDQFIPVKIDAGNINDIAEGNIELDPVETTEPVTTEGEPVTSEGEPVTSEGEPVTSEGEPVTSEGEPVTTEGEPVTSEGEPVTPDVEPVTPDVEPVTTEGESEIVPDSKFGTYDEFSKTAEAMTVGTKFNMGGIEFMRLTEYGDILVVEDGSIIKDKEDWQEFLKKQ